jgi:hypothetical protein
MFRSIDSSALGPRSRRRGPRAVVAVALATSLVGGLAACGDDDEDDMNDVDVTTDVGVVPGTDTGSSSDITTGGSTGDSTMTTPVSGSVSNDDGGSDATMAP